MNRSTTNNDPTYGQIKYIKDLAAQTETSFTYPKTKAEASREINRLLQLKESRRTPAYEYTEEDKPSLEHAEVEEPDLLYATAVRAGEVAGYGSAASWHTDPSSSVTTHQTPKIGDLTELERYRVSSGERILYAQQINGGMRITDRPAAGAGRSYLVDRELEQDELSALVADYIAQADKLGEIPMASSVIRRYLQQVGAAE